jgi:acid phosphatase family membrane protein YuiD
MTSGLGSVYFSIAFILAVIVMYDAAGVRQSVGQQSVIINRIVKTHKLEIDQTLREFIGHTHLQVLVGALLGILISWTAFTLIV